MLEQYLTWAVLAPADLETLQPLVAKAWIDRFGADEDEVRRWEIVQCRTGYCAVLCAEPGTEGDDEALALLISSHVQGEVYALRFLDEAQAIWVYSGAAFLREEADSPWQVAERLGCALKPPAADIQRRSVLVVEGAAPEAVRLAVQRSVGKVPVTYTPVPLGTMVYAPRGDVAMLSSDISTALPEATVYTVMVGPTPERFGVLVGRGDDDLGSFEANGAPLPGHIALDAILGKGDPGGILDALGVSDDVFGAPWRRFRH